MPTGLFRNAGRYFGNRRTVEACAARARASQSAHDVRSEPACRGRGLCRRSGAREHALDADGRARVHRRRIGERGRRDAADRERPSCTDDGGGPAHRRAAGPAPLLPAGLAARGANARRHAGVGGRSAAAGKVRAAHRGLRAPVTTTLPAGSGSRLPTALSPPGMSLCPTTAARSRRRAGPFSPASALRSMHAPARVASAGRASTGASAAITSAARSARASPRLVSHWAGSGAGRATAPWTSPRSDAGCSTKSMACGWRTADELLSRSRPRSRRRLSM